MDRVLFRRVRPFAGFGFECVCVFLGFGFRLGLFRFGFLVGVGFV